jgi:hypothetical protein
MAHDSFEQAAKRWSVMNMNKEQFNFANLSQNDLEQISMLEKTLTEKKGEEVILIAYQDKQNH